MAHRLDLSVLCEKTTPEAVRRGIPLRAGIVEVVADQGIEAAMAELRALGVTKMHADRSGGVGRGCGHQAASYLGAVWAVRAWPSS